MSDPNAADEGNDSPRTDETSDNSDTPETPDTGEDGALSEDDYALGETSDPGGATRDEPAGEDYAGSGF